MQMGHSAAVSCSVTALRGSIAKAARTLASSNALCSARSAAVPSAAMRSLLSCQGMTTYWRVITMTTRMDAASTKPTMKEVVFMLESK